MMSHAVVYQLWYMIDLQEVLELLKNLQNPSGFFSKLFIFIKETRYYKKNCDLVLASIFFQSNSSIKNDFL